MQLRALSQLNFRNLQTPRLEFGPGVTALVGRNASGKSNVLDAAYLGCTGELPGGRIVESVRLGEEEGYVGTEVCHDEGTSTVQVGLAPGRKVLRLDGQHVRALDIARVCTAVLVTPEDAELVHGSPSRRRGYLDALLARLSPRYAALSRGYARVVEQRNAALKAPGAAATLEVWTERFVQLGTEIEALRRRAVTRVDEIAREVYGEIAGDGKRFAVELASGRGGMELDAALAASRAEELARGVTVVGPHRDDLLLELGGHPVGTYGSRGEARTAALALRVAEYRLLAQKHGEDPVLLLDDFTAELDEERRRFLLRLAASAPQALVSGTEAPPRSDALFRIAAGVVTRE